MEVAQPTIAETFTEFLTEHEKRLASSTFRKYREVVELFRHSLDNYAHQGLSTEERAFWEQHWDQDEEAGSFTNTFGPDKILENVGEFLGYFMVRKVWASKALLTAAVADVRKRDSRLLNRPTRTENQALQNRCGPSRGRVGSIPSASAKGTV